MYDKESDIKWKHPCAVFGGDATLCNMVLLQFSSLRAGIRSLLIDIQKHSVTKLVMIGVRARMRISSALGKTVKSTSLCTSTQT